MALRVKRPRPSRDRARETYEAVTGGAVAPGHVIMKVREKPDPTAPKKQSKAQQEREEFDRTCKEIEDRHEKLKEEQAEKLKTLPF